MRPTRTRLLATTTFFLGMATALAATTPTTAFGIIDDMGAGWNLGNTMDGTGGETGWNNPKTTKTMIDTVRLAGFKTMRLPVRWDEHVSGSGFTIEAAWLNRVEEIANYALSNGMYVIVNVHHHDGWEDPTAANESKAKDHLTKLWAQIAAKFKSYDNHVIFEVMNEPNVTTNGTTDWTGKQEYYDVINRLDAAALATIRGTGGNNASRLVMVPGYSANNDSRMSKLVVPNDPMVAVSVHSYDPQAFCMSYSTPNLTTFTDTKYVQDMFNLVANTFVKKNIPVILGEWAATNKNNLSERVKHAKFFAQQAKAARIPIILWDNGNTKVDPDGMGFLDRRTPKWAFPDIIRAIIAEYPSAVAPAPSRANPFDLRVVRAADGLHFESPAACDRFVLTGVDGRSRSLPGGTTGFVATGSLPAGLYALRAESREGTATRTVLVD